MSALKLVVYNLGYLPQSDHTITTCVKTTLASVNLASQLVLPGGAISITCYPGHEEGAREEQALLSWVQTLDWKIFYYVWRPKSPTLLWLKKQS